MLRFPFLPLTSFGVAGEGRQQEVLSGDILVMPLSSASPARDDTDEPILEKGEPSTKGTGTLSPATKVAGRDDATSQRLDAGNQLP
jgi:hypothetical protein